MDSRLYPVIAMCLMIGRISSARCARRRPPSARPAPHAQTVAQQNRGLVGSPHRGAAGSCSWNRSRIGTPVRRPSAATARSSRPSRLAIACKGSSLQPGPVRPVGRCRSLGAAGFEMCRYEAGVFRGVMVRLERHSGIERIFLRPVRVDYAWERSR